MEDKKFKYRHCILDNEFMLFSLGMIKTSLVAQRLKHLSTNVGDLGSIPGLGRSPGEGNGNPLQYPCLENPMDGGAWRATVHRIAKNQTQLSDFTEVHKVLH